LGDSNLPQTFFFTAECYLALNYSVIPLYGDADPARPKVPAVGWGAYQKSRPSLEQCRQWFLEDGFLGLGIVTGAISRLAVLDFDTAEAFRTFRSRYPALAEYQVIQTRRGYHVYFQLPPNFRLSSRKGKGVDLLAEGSYVVARPTVIAGYPYKLVQGGMPLLLGLSEVQAIWGFVDAYVDQLPVASCQLPVKRREQPLPEVKRPLAGGLVPDESQVVQKYHIVPKYQSSVLSLQSFLPLYRRLVEVEKSRNQALFRVACVMRDQGIPLERALEALVEPHVHQGPVNDHRPEYHETRRCEAFQTVRSAYSRPPRSFTVEKTDWGGLPNAAREKLFCLKRTDVVRVWDGLRLRGVLPGMAFTIADAVSLLEGIVGRDSVYHALQWTLLDGEAIFAALPPSAHPQASDDAAADTEPGIPNKCVFGRAEKSGIIRRGRKTRVFVMPDRFDICRKLGVEISCSDKLTLDDLASAKTTRQAVHRELIKRRPGTYPRFWLARRLGVCTETLDDYNRETPIYFRHQYLEQRITWANLHLIPDESAVDGTFLEDETGKRYPPRRPLAAKLLGQGKSVTYKRQDANYYWYGETPPDLGVLMGLHSKRDELAANMARIQQFMAEQATRELDLKETKADIAANGQLSPHFVTHTGEKQGRGEVKTERSLPPASQSPAKKAEPLPSGRRRLADDTLENFANRVYERVNRLSADPALHIGMAAARRLVSQYSRDLVETALRLLESRRNIAKPAGFFITVLRSEAKRTT